MSHKRSGIVKKKVDSRIKKLLENGVKNKHRSFMILIGKRGKSQIVNLHWLLTRCANNETPSILWCYRDNLGFSPNHIKQVQKIKKDIKRGLRTADLSDPFEAFILSNKIRYTKFRDSSKILGQTFKCLIIQNFESITPNLLARTIETVAGGGLIIFLLETIMSLKQLYTMSMDVHKRFRTPSHSLIIPRFNERFTLSLADCTNCLIADDELNILPITSYSTQLLKAKKDRDCKESDAKSEQLEELKDKLRDTKPIGDIINLCLTVDQAKAVLIFLEAIAAKTLSSTVILTAARGRGKSAALGLAIAGAISLQYANIFVTSPTPENLKTLFEIALNGLEALGYKEHIDYEIIQSTNAAFNRAIVRLNIFKNHRQTVQYIQPCDAIKLSSAELLIVDEAAAIPLPTVKKLMGPYLVFLSSTVNGYEGTGRSLSLKLVNNLRKQSIKSHKNTNTNENGRRLREISLEEAIRYADGDPIELWLNDLLCLNCCSEYNVNSRINVSLSLAYHPDPEGCELYYVNRDSLFSYNTISEHFLQSMMSLYVSSHYKNQPNDLQLISDAPAHQLFVLLPPQHSQRNTQSAEKLIPDILCVIQCCFEGNLSKKIVKTGLLQGKRMDGDLIPWVMSQQFQDDDFAKLSGVRIVRIATHPHIQSMGYGTKALSLLIKYFEGKIVDLDEITEPPAKKRKIDAADGGLKVRDNLPVLLMNVSQRRAERLHWIGVSYGLTLQLFKFWKRNEFKPVYLRQVANEVTGEHSCIMIRTLSNNEVLNKVNWINSFSIDFSRRFEYLLAYNFRHLDIITALSVFNPKETLLENNKKLFKNLKASDEKSNVISYDEIMLIFSDWDLKRFETYNKNLINVNLIKDMIPKLCHLFFNNKFEGKLQLNYSQCAILLGIGFQKKSVEEICAELSIIKQQSISMLNKSVRKIYSFIHQVICDHIQEYEIAPLYDNKGKKAVDINPNTMFDPMVKLKDELKKIGRKKKKEERLGALSNYVPSSISIRKESRLVTMPKTQNPNTIDPQHFQNQDRAKGINPNDRFHWNRERREKKKKRKKSKKQRESKVLEVWKANRNRNKTKQQKHRETYFCNQ